MLFFLYTTKAARYSTAMWALGGLAMAAPYVRKLGPAPLRRWLLDRLPLPKVQHLKGLADVMDERSKDIISEKRVALQKGDEAVLQQVGEGKDIMSILCTLDLSSPYDDFPNSNFISPGSESEYGSFGEG